MNYISRFNNKIGEEYSLFALSVPHHEEFQNTITKELQSYCNALKKERIDILEIGTGNGITTARILDADSRIVITTIDDSQTMLNQARSILGDSKRIKFVEDDALSALANLSESSFDCFASCYTLHNFTDEYRDKVFVEINRILKSNSYFINADKIAQDDPVLFQESFEEQIKRFGIYDDPAIGRSDIRKAWTSHYYEDLNTKLIELNHIRTLQLLGFEAQLVFRKDMEAVITAIKTN
jgi:ubiquinone/menaquinone biosynthesis C-methylase UbiE